MANECKKCGARAFTTFGLCGACHRSGVDRSREKYVQALVKGGMTREQAEAETKKIEGNPARAPFRYQVEGQRPPTCEDCGSRPATHFALTIDPKSTFRILPHGTFEGAMRDPKMPQRRWCEKCARHRSDHHATDVGSWVWSHDEQTPQGEVDVWEVFPRYGTTRGLSGPHPGGECNVAAENPRRKNRAPASGVRRDLPRCDTCGRPASWTGGGGAVAEVAACDVHKKEADRLAEDDPSVDRFEWERIGGEKRTRRNPYLVLVGANPPPPAAIEQAWCRFHQRDRYDGKTVDLGSIRGAPAFSFALGRLHDIQFGGRVQTIAPRPWIVCNPADDSLWIISRTPINARHAAGLTVQRVTYDPTEESGKEPALYRHLFDAPRPTLAPVGNVAKCHAIMLDGGKYRVTDWIHD